MYLIDVFIPRLMCLRLRLIEIRTVRSFSPIYGHFSLNKERLWNFKRINMQLSHLTGDVELLQVQPPE